MNPDRPAPNLPVIRIIWAALLMGQLIFLGILMFVLWGHQPQPDPNLLKTLLFVLIAMAVVVIPVTWFIRARMFAAAREKSGTGSLPLGVYCTGNIIFWAGCEGVSFFGLVCTMLNNGPWPYLAVSIVAMALQALTFPTGSATDASL